MFYNQADSTTAHARKKTHAHPLPRTRPQAHKLLLRRPRPLHPPQPHPRDRRPLRIPIPPRTLRTPGPLAPRAQARRQPARVRGKHGDTERYPCARESIPARVRGNPASMHFASTREYPGNAVSSSAANVDDTIYRIQPPPAALSPGPRVWPIPPPVVYGAKGNRARATIHGAASA